jgi:hypothetical protein
MGGDGRRKTAVPARVETCSARWSDGRVPREALSSTASCETRVGVSEGSASRWLLNLGRACVQPIRRLRSLVRVGKAFVSPRASTRAAVTGCPRGEGRRPDWSPVQWVRRFGAVPADSVRGIANGIDIRWAMTAPAPRYQGSRPSHVLCLRIGYEPIIAAGHNTVHATRNGWVDQLVVRATFAGDR